MKKKLLALAAASCLALSLVGCSNSDQSASSDSDSAEAETVEVKTSTDKHVSYIKDYRGMKAASVGYTALAGDRRDAYGETTLVIHFLAPNGEYLDPENEDQLKEYVVSGQDLAPNTELNITFQLDEDGEEYDSLVDVANYDSIVLAVHKIGQADTTADKLVTIEPSPDKYTRMVKNYVGLNAADIGYTSLGGDCRDYYGHGNIKLELIADDGSYLDPEDTEALSQYVVTEQNVEPNTAITMTYMTDEKGEEYSNLIDSQNIESISLKVSKI